MCVHVHTHVYVHVMCVQFKSIENLLRLKFKIGCKVGVTTLFYYKISMQ